MNRKPLIFRLRLRGFTLLELQVAIVLLAFGVVTLGSLMVTQSRLTKRLTTGYTSGSTVHVTRSLDPWVRRLSTPARLTPQEIAQSAPPAVTQNNTVSIVATDPQLDTETLTVTADVTPIP
jgi:hypothetical protein